MGLDQAIDDVLSDAAYGLAIAAETMRVSPEPRHLAWCLMTLRVRTDDLHRILVGLLTCDSEAEGMTLAQIEHLREKNKGLPKGWEAVFVNEGQDDGNPQFSLRYMRDGVLQVERPGAVDASAP